MHSVDTVENNHYELQLRQLVRDEIDTYMRKLTTICKSNKIPIQCMMPASSLNSEVNDWLSQHFILRQDYEQDLTRLTERQTLHSSSFLSFFDEKKVSSIVEDALKRYDADKIAMPDYALESVGGSVIMERTSQTYIDRSPVLNIFGIPILRLTVTPNTILKVAFMLHKITDKKL
ncbi:unnamed protein product [Didymodactylos carnosus]|uniref:Uncharacterized protein n=1 Tax=Didymodactylos carnosus TaxID=1234261 RepID=A0A813SHP8_9BILA|nr:unnamed protein product [Didymodactylos carnosus]CAF3584614.1 unnamed protein product [Didymodactylos carnosus]